jgi:hypothetical protein
MTRPIPDAFENDYCYDVEVFPNCFLTTVVHIRSGHRWIYEISDRVDHSIGFVAMINSLRAIGARMIGFNNLAFDYPLIHYAMALFDHYGTIPPAMIYEKMTQILHEQGANRFAHRVWQSDQIVKQVDLFSIHHFDNNAKRTSLKAIQFNMRMALVMDMPVAHGSWLTADQVRELTFYNCHDVNSTCDFYERSLHMLRMREELSKEFGRDFTNDNDTKIGKSFFQMQLESRGVICFERGPDGKRPRQTWRSSIPLGPLILPFISFRDPELIRVHDYLRGTTLTETNKPPELEKLTATIKGFTIHFGAGGGHGSVRNRSVRADADHELIDVDVKSYYPNIAIKNGIYPEHLSPIFCDVYAELYDMRATLPKKSAKSAMLKLAMNGVFGDSNQEFSCFRDPAYTMAITINGQLMLCELAEWQLAHPQIEAIQLNTDGITFRVHKAARAWFDDCCKAWESHTALTLETVRYREMHIRDVNNYLAVDVDGNVKRKGVYQHDTSDPSNVAVSLGWHQDWSALVIPKAAEAALIKGIAPADFIARHDDPFDFMIRERSTGKSKLALFTPAPGKAIIEPQQQTVRYHIVATGPSLVKIMPQLQRTLDKNPDADSTRLIRVNVGWSVNVCNRAEDFDWSRLDRRYYVEEATKLLGMMS